MADSASYRVDAVPVIEPQAQAIVREYLVDIIGRYYGRPCTPQEVDAALDEDPNTGLAPPTGAFLIASGEDPLGCVGVRLMDGGFAELKRMYVRPRARGRGVGRALLTAAEATAVRLGASELRLDTRTDLVEARTLYEAAGFVEIPPYNGALHAQHWYAKQVGGYSR